MNRRMSIAVFFSAMVFASLSCQSPTGVPDMSLAPPDWIIGTWSDEYGVNTCQFTEDNVIFSLDVGDVATIIDFRVFYRDSGIVESSSETSYALTLVAVVDTTVYQFLNNSDGTLDYSISTDGVSIGQIILLRR